MSVCDQLHYPVNSQEWVSECGDIKESLMKPFFTQSPNPTSDAYHVSRAMVVFKWGCHLPRLITTWFCNSKKQEVKMNFGHFHMPISGQALLAVDKISRVNE